MRARDKLIFLDNFSTSSWKKFDELSTIFKTEQNTTKCKRDSFSGALRETRETHWERVSHALKVN